GFELIGGCDAEEQSDTGQVGSRQQRDEGGEWPAHGAERTVLRDGERDQSPGRDPQHQMDR
ncbi:hypothetical protein, partial [Pantoea sp. GbtcB22]|uniref:hypothetical protein n=1 Tax=Pantoea sp. GbtcB22 TaxID=2824767 RepID=UPI001C2F7C49